MRSDQSGIPVRKGGEDVKFVLALMQRLELEILRASNDRLHRTLNRLTYRARQSNDVG